MADARTCEHPAVFHASDGFGGVRCTSCRIWLVRSERVWRLIAGALRRRIRRSQ